MWWINMSPDLSTCFKTIQLWSWFGNNSRNVPGMAWANIRKKKTQTWGKEVWYKKKWPSLNRCFFFNKPKAKVHFFTVFKFSQGSVIRLRFVVKSPQMFLSSWNKKCFHHVSSWLFRGQNSKWTHGEKKSNNFCSHLGFNMFFLVQKYHRAMYPTLEQRIHTWWWNHIILGKLWWGNGRLPKTKKPTWWGKLVTP